MALEKRRRLVRRSSGLHPKNAVRLRVGAALVLLSLFGIPVSSFGGEPELRIGSKRFTESYILAEIAAAQVRHAGAGAPTHEQGLGGTAVVFRALQEGSIDVYPEYTGTLAEAVLHVPGRSDIPTLRHALSALGLGITEALGFDDTYALSVLAKRASERHLITISDLARQRDLQFGFSPEFLGRSDGFPGLASRYGLSMDRVREIDHGLAYEALSRGAIDVMDVYSTDAAVQRYGLRVLTDDLHFFPSYQAVFVYRQDSARRLPSAFQAIEALEGTINAAAMSALNASAELQKETFPSIAEKFIRSRTGETALPIERREGLVRGILSTIRSEGPRHVGLVVISLFFAIAVGIPLGIIARKARILGVVILGATGMVQTIPSLALLCFFIPVLGTGRLPALAALFLYSLLPIARNTVAGLESIPPSLRESAAALGLGARARLFRVELPLASPTILAGIRTSAIIGVGTATLAAFIGAGGFGAPISTGLNLNDDNLILEGAIPAALLALLVEGFFALLGRWLIPAGLRLPAARSDET